MTARGKNVKIQSLATEVYAISFIFGSGVRIQG